MTKYKLLLFLVVTDLVIFAVMQYLPIQGIPNGSFTEAAVDSNMTSMWSMVTFRMPGTGIIAGMWWIMHGAMLAAMIADYVRGIGS